MKKNDRNALSLRAQTIRSLRPSALSEARGGCFSSGPPADDGGDLKQYPPPDLKPYH